MIIVACKFFEFKQLGNDLKNLAGEKEFESQIMVYIRICLVRMVLVFCLSRFVAYIVETGKEVDVGSKRLILAFELVIEKKQRACRAIGEFMHIQDLNNSIFGSGGLSLIPTAPDPEPDATKNISDNGHCYNRSDTPLTPLPAKSFNTFRSKTIKDGANTFDDRGSYSKHKSLAEMTTAEYFSKNKGSKYKEEVSDTSKRQFILDMYMEGLEASKWIQLVKLSKIMDKKYILD